MDWDSLEARISTFTEQVQSQGRGAAFYCVRWRRKGVALCHAPTFLSLSRRPT